MHPFVIPEFNKGSLYSALELGKCYIRAYLDEPDKLLITQDQIINSIERLFFDSYFGMNARCMLFETMMEDIFDHIVPLDFTIDLEYMMDTLWACKPLSHHGYSLNLGKVGLVFFKDRTDCYNFRKFIPYNFKF